MLNSNISSTCPHNMVNFDPLTAEIGWRVWGTGTPNKLQRFLASLLHRRRSTEVNQNCTTFGCLLDWYIFIRLWGLLPPNGILPGAKFTLRPSRAFSYIGTWQHYCPRHSSSARQPNFASWYKERNYGNVAPRHFQQRAAITLGVGPHSSFIVYLLAE